jgi:hypothetical protein
LKIGCIEEIEFRLGCIDAEQVVKIAEEMIKNEYG